MSTPRRNSSLLCFHHCASAAVVLLMLCGLTAPTLGQSRDLTIALSGMTHPLTVKLKELNADWRRVTINSGPKISDNVSVNVSGNASGSVSQNNLAGSLAGSRHYLTRGETVSAAGRTYLVAYHLPGSGLDLGALIQAAVTKTPPQAVTLSPETTLPLSLLDLASVGSLEEVRAFDLQGEIAESERAAKMLAEILKSQSNESKTNRPAGPGKSETNK